MGTSTNPTFYFSDILINSGTEILKVMILRKKHVKILIRLFGSKLFYYKVDKWRGGMINYLHVLG